MPPGQPSIQSEESSDEAAGYVDETLEKDAQAAAEPPKPFRPKRSRLPILLTLLPILIGLTAFNINHALDDSDPFTPAEKERFGYFVMMLAHEEIEAYRDSIGEYPPNLEMIGAEDDVLTYELVGNSYMLRFWVDGMGGSYRGDQSFDQIEVRYDSIAGTSP